MKYLILFLSPTLALANFVKEGGNTTYAQKDMCEKTEGAKCYPLPANKAEVVSLKDVEVDDTEKPIIEVTEPTLERNPENGLDEQRCEAPFELQDGKCKRVTGFEKKLEKQFVEDPVKVKAKEDKKKVIEAKALSCEQYKALLMDSAINDKSKLEDVMEVTKRLLNYHKLCGG